jgi:hypothetical protein
MIGNRAAFQRLQRLYGLSGHGQTVIRPAAPGDLLIGRCGGIPWSFGRPSPILEDLEPD